MNLQGGNVGHQGIQRTARHIVTHCHIDFFHLWRQAVQKRYEKLLVGQNQRSLLRAAVRKQPQNIRQNLHLPHSRRNGHNIHLRRGVADFLKLV